MRRNCLSKYDWVDLKWNGGQINHSTQKDWYSCGVFVMQTTNQNGAGKLRLHRGRMKEVVGAFPNIPCHFTLNSSKEHMEHLRLTMAEELLKASVFKRGHYCSLCAASKSPGGGAETFSIDCHCCKTGYHVACLSLSEKQFKRAQKVDWKCCLSLFLIRSASCTVSSCLITLPN
ncbi:hypothetical protein AMELA_G00169410 [Ameiurus melas]|uniref:PHD-type domain-containing protein n=1 Tax=Ameiurus melas TaxID=219545 RepID=A0A7J6ABN0_AMEME|nr:hypothetical protein AMELA_G00169410 [Ameiurus melas]